MPRPNDPVAEPQPMQPPPDDDPEPSRQDAGNLAPDDREEEQHDPVREHVGDEDEESPDGAECVVPG